MVKCFWKELFRSEQPNVGKVIQEFTQTLLITSTGFEQTLKRENVQGFVSTMVPNQNKIRFYLFNMFYSFNGYRGNHYKKLLSKEFFSVFFFNSRLTIVNKNRSYLFFFWSDTFSHYLFVSSICSIYISAVLLLPPWALDIITLVYFFQSRNVLIDLIYQKQFVLFHSFSFFLLSFFFRLAEMQLYCWWWDDAVFFNGIYFLSLRYHNLCNAQKNY